MILEINHGMCMPFLYATSTFSSCLSVRLWMAVSARLNIWKHYIAYSYSSVYLSWKTVVFFLWRSNDDLLLQERNIDG